MRARPLRGAAGIGSRPWPACPPSPARPPRSRPRWSRYGPLALIVGGALALIVAEFLTMREIKAVTAVPAGGRTTGGAHHGYALAIVGLAALPMGVGAALGGSRPAAVAVTALGLVAVAIVLLADAPSLDDTGPDRAQLRPRRRPARGRASGSRRPGRRRCWAAGCACCCAALRPARTRRPQRSAATGS